MSRKDKKAHLSTALVPMVRVESESSAALRSDIKTMVARARSEFHDDVAKVMEETAMHAAEVEKAIGDLSQREALEGVRQFFLDEITRKIERYD